VRLGRTAALIVLGLATTACGGGGGGGAISVPTIAPAREYTLAWQSAKTLPKPGTTTVRFAVRTPDGKILSKFRTGPGPHTGVHLIIVRDDLSSIIHLHPPIPPSGRLAISVTLPRAGRYHVLVDVYPADNSGPRNFQLTRDIQVGKGDAQTPLPAYTPVVHTGGLTFRVTQLPKLKLAQPGSMIVNVTDAQGKPVHFKPFYGALAHAIFFSVGSLNYFHSHICGNDPACTAGFGTPATTGHSTKPGKLELGVLLPATGRWRLFLQVLWDGKLVTAPFTLRVH
jgi:hypothetical protein